MNDNKALERAEIIAALGAIEVGGVSGKYHGPYLFRMQDALTDAAALLEQDAKPPNEPLTLEELQGMDGEPIYIQYIGTCEGFYDNETSPYYGQFEQYVQKYNGMLRACDLPLKYYGKTWLAYRCKPDGGGE